jgi:hypothetical protein
MFLPLTHLKSLHHLFNLLLFDGGMYLFKEPAVGFVISVIISGQFFIIISYLRLIFLLGSAILNSVIGFLFGSTIKLFRFTWRLMYSFIIKSMVCLFNFVFQCVIFIKLILKLHLQLLFTTSFSQLIFIWKILLRITILFILHV